MTGLTNESASIANYSILLSFHEADGSTPPSMTLMNALVADGNSSSRQSPKFWGQNKAQSSPAESSNQQQLQKITVKTTTTTALHQLLKSESLSPPKRGPNRGGRTAAHGGGGAGQRKGAPQPLVAAASSAEALASTIAYARITFRFLNI